MQDEEFDIRRNINLNRNKFEKLGYDFYKFVQNSAYKGVQAHMFQMSPIIIDRFLTFDTS